MWQGLFRASFVVAVSCVYALRIASAQASIYEDAVVQSVNPGGNDSFGAPSVLDGDRLLVGAPTANDSGEVQLFDIGPPVLPAGFLVGGDVQSGDGFGGAFALWGDVLVVGGNRHVHGAPDAGAAWIFRWNGAAWVEEAELLASDRADGDGFGSQVDLSRDTVVVGAPGCDISGAIDQGAIYVFERNSGSWTQVLKATAWDGAAGDRFGYQVSIDGLSIAAVSELGSAGWPGSGALYTFRRSAGAWTQETKLGPQSGARYGTFGWGLDVEDDVIVAGMPYGSLPPGEGTGLVYVYRRLDGIWTEEAVLQPHVGAALDQFGFSVRIQGERVVAGVPGKSDPPNHMFLGEALMFERVNGVWTQGLRLIPSAAVDQGWVGSSVSIDGDHVASGSAYASYSVFLYSPPSRIGSPYCSGDGSGSPCPCENESDTWLGLGCANASGFGAALAARGSTSVAADDIVFTAGYMKSSGVALVVLGVASGQVNGGLGKPFGDGLRCIEGGFRRLGVQSGGMAAVFGPGLAALGGWSSGETREFQAIYRDRLGPCGLHTNTSNALEVVFSP